MKGRLGKGWLVGLMAIAGALFLIGVACGGWGAGSDPSKETPAFGVTEVRLEDFGFAPANIVIDAGTTVIWTNHDSVDHTVTSDEGDYSRANALARTGRSAIRSTRPANTITTASHTRTCTDS